MGMASPAALGLLVAVALVGLLAWATLRWQQAAQAKLAGGSGALLLAGAASTRRRALKAGLVVGALAVLVVGAAGPYAGQGPEPIKPQRADVLVVLDVSLSMLAQDVAPSRFELARRAVHSLLDSLQSDRVGIAVFGGRAALRAPFTLDYAAVRSVLDAIAPDSAPAPGSNLSEALRMGLAALRHSDAPRKGILLISDGEDLGSEVQAAVAELRDAGIPVNTLGTGTAQGGTIPVRDPRTGQVSLKRDQAGQVVTTRLDEATLRSIASQTGGVYLPASGSGRELLRLYEALRAPTLALPDESPEVPVATLTPWLALLALALLVADLLVAERPVPRRALTPRAAAVAGAAVLMLLPACAEVLDETFVFNQQGLGAYERGQYVEALEAFRNAQVRRPDLPELDFNVGAALYKNGEDERALREWQRAAQTDKEALRRSAEFNSGNAHFLLERFEDAIEAYKRVLRSSPADLDAKINLELALQKLQPPPQQRPQPPGTPQDQPRGDADPGPQGDQPQPPQQPQQGQQGPDPQQNQQPPQGGQNQQPTNPQGGQSPQQPGQPGQPGQEAGQQPLTPQEQERQAREALRRALAEAGPEFTIEEALRVLEALRQRERQLQGQYNRPPDTPGQPAQRPPRDW